MMPTEPPSARSATALARAPFAFFCSQSCPGDIILKAQDWANARGPESAPVIGGFHTPIERDVLRILLRGSAPVTRYDRCAHTFMCAICIAATIIFWLGQ